jgi:hypothetical protein
MKIERSRVRFPQPVLARDKNYYVNVAAPAPAEAWSSGNVLNFGGVGREIDSRQGTGC